MSQLSYQVINDKRVYTSVNQQAVTILAATLIMFIGQTYPYVKAVFMRISDEYAANILRTALFTVIVRYIFTSCREYPENKVGLTKK